MHNPILPYASHNFSSVENADKDTWLCGEDFTLADINLAILLHRLNFVGYSGGIIDNGLMPNVEDYYAKLKNRQSYKDVCEYSTSHRLMIYLMFHKYRTYIGIGGLVLVGVGVGFYLFSRRK